MEVLDNMVVSSLVVLTQHVQKTIFQEDSTPCYRTQILIGHVSALIKN